jgi:ABC-type transport system involved in multi-copper enzyme maturation permease subunit
MEDDRQPSTWRLILEREWLLNGAAVVGLMIWVGILSLVPGFGSPLEQLLLCILIATLIGFRLGSSDTLEGAEEFAHCLPATRFAYFFSRYSAGLLMSLFFVSVFTLAELYMNYSRGD